LPWHRDGDWPQARAVVIESEGIAGEYGPWGCKLTLRVHFDDGTTGEFKTKKRTADLSGRIPTEGDILPVRYDPRDRSKVELDVDAIKAQVAAEERDLKDHAIARAEAELDGSARASDPLDAASFADTAAKFAADSRAFLESSVAARAKMERAANHGAMPAETLSAIDQQHAAGMMDDETYQELRTKLLGGEL
jgi:hypothetical protein